MKLNLSYQPEDDDELLLIERIANARDDALEHGVSEDTVERVLLLFLLEGSGMESLDTKPPDTPVCPECGESVESVETTGIGEEPSLIPCGCVVEFDMLSDALLDMMLDQ